MFLRVDKNNGRNITFQRHWLKIYTYTSGWHYIQCVKQRGSCKGCVISQKKKKNRLSETL